MNTLRLAVVTVLVGFAAGAGSVAIAEEPKASPQHEAKEGKRVEELTAQLAREKEATEFLAQRLQEAEAAASKNYKPRACGSRLCRCKPGSDCDAVCSGKPDCGYNGGSMCLCPKK